ncbi:MAG: polymerase delta subunit, partial [Acidimicrobiia bacterium]|nr:polymerase delta subunit [Acidimicrobiia bacterium]
MNPLWNEVIGQGDAVRALQGAAASPVHAYLLLGPAGSGKRALARAFAAAVLGDDPRDVELVRRGEHPDVREIERV